MQFAGEYMTKETLKSNISLIGMPSCGKSTIGVILAKTLLLSFIDTDLLIQEKHNKLLSEIIQHEGIERFIEKESNVISSLFCSQTCIATGGSAVYSKKAMEHLKRISTVFFIDVPFREIEKRISNIKTRGVVIDSNKSLIDIYHERYPLYKKYADVIINADKKKIEEIVTEIKGAFS